ncbi:thiamine pyrophosphate-binding protein [Mesorhizobium sp. M0615]|uniref:thiamine pyrophosphate-dependent enzyme n=1 Tax=unclassified Mesorhizobium TaxID=325217 RepID=UPI0003CED0FE|nr:MULTISPECIES: thiamine pyrophosphate-dependent enzyme [unclassified Mesorhizobium]ESY11729.1 pyruvate oxidase [Mesorhizobium sp. LNJC398B00]ESY37392.1 pyruvate oxidase [Mesorhizobium sp. LNJC386A00]
MPTAADILIETLIDWNVDIIFGLPGDGINGIMEALRRRQDRIRFIQVRHEESAAFMACAYSKWTGKLGVCLATSGPGGTHLLTGLYDAKLDQAPVLAITGMQFHDLIETFTQQDVDLTRVFSDVAVFNAQVSDAAHMESLAGLACRSALARRGVAHLSIASDVQEHTLDQAKRSKRNKPSHTPDRWFEGSRLPDEEQLAKAAEILNGATKAAILAGRGALGARHELEETAELVGAPVAKALLGKAALPDDHPLTTGGIGILGTLPSQEIMEECDALLVVGSSFPYIEYYPKPGQARGVQIERDPQRIGLRYPVEAGLAGDAAVTLRLLNKRLKRKDDRSFLEKAQAGMRRWREMMAQSEQKAATSLKPQVVTRAFGKRLPDDAILVADSGQNTEMAARHIELRDGQAFGVSGALASMACGLPYAIAAGLAFPGRPVFAVVGDGGLAMQLGEFSTAVRYRVPLKVLVLKNGMLNQIAWEQMMFLGNPQFACELQPIDFAMAAEAMGGIGYSVSRAEEVEGVLDAALAAEGPVVIEAVVDPYEPMMPPKMPPDYAKNFRKALSDTPGRAEIEANVAQEPLRSMITAGEKD